MKRSNSKSKALSAFKKLGAVALITATLAMCFTACKQTSGGNSGTGGGGGKPTPTPTPKPKHAITFSVDGANGKLKAKADGIDETETSPINVEEGKTVTFTATANDSYRVKGWTLDGKPIAEAGIKTEYKHTITKPAVIKVSFEAIPPAKHAVSFSVVDGKGGTLKAKSEGIEETEASPITIEEGKSVTFMAKANAGYSVKGWTLDGKPIAEAGTKTEYTHIVTKPCAITVSFEEIPKHKITFKVLGSNGWFKAMVGEVEITSGREIEEGKVITFTATPDATYRVKEWKVDNATIEGNKTNTYTHTVTKPCAITVSFEKIPKHKITFDVEGENWKGGTIKAKVDEVEIYSGNELEEGKEITFTAKPYAGYKLKEWKLDGKAIVEAGTKAEYTHTVTKPCKITVSFKLLPPGEAILTLDPNKRYITVTAWTADGSAITVEGCNETTLASGYKTTLYANGTTIILKGYIMELDCSGSYYYRQSLTALNVQGCASLQKLNCSFNKLTSLNVQGLTNLQELNCHYNQLTALNVQGLTALKYLWCCSNQLNAQAMTELLKGLPTRTADDITQALLYTEKTGEPEGNCKDFTQPEDLKKAFEDAKSRNWKLQKLNASGCNFVDI